MKNEIRMIIKPSHRPSAIDNGWGNGYILIPMEHELHNIHYDNIDIEAYCGLTFSEIITEDRIDSWKLSEDMLGMWAIGFDTAHYGDTKSNRSKDWVLIETYRLMMRVENGEYKIKKDLD